jgi:hypothetical protein
MPGKGRKGRLGDEEHTRANQGENGALRKRGMRKQIYAEQTLAKILCSALPASGALFAEGGQD